jgi:hypothetical protein
MVDLFRKALQGSKSLKVDRHSFTLGCMHSPPTSVQFADSIHTSLPPTIGAQKQPAHDYS